MGVAVVTTKFRAVDSYSSVVRKMQRTTGSFARKAQAGFRQLRRNLAGVGRELSSINKKFRMMSKVGLLAGGISLAAAASAGADSFLSLDKNISAAAAKFGIFNRESADFLKIRNAAQQIGATTEFTASQAAEGLNFLAMAGFTAEQSIASLAGLIDLATASEVELAVASDIATDTLGALGFASADAATKQRQLNRITDVLTATTTGANVTMETMFETIQDALPIFKNAGGTLEEFAAITGIMGNAGIKGTKAGTAIKNMMIRLQAPTKQVTKALNSMGINIDDGTGKMKSMSTIVSEMMNNTKDWTQIQKNAALSTIFGKQAIAGSIVTMKAGKEEIDKFVQSVKEADMNDLTKSMAKFMRSGISGGLAAMKSSFEAIAIAIGDVFQPEIDIAIKNVTEFARNTKEWLGNNKDLIKSIVNVTLKLIPLIVGMKILLSVISLINAAMALNPYVAAAIAIAALIAGIYLLITAWEDSKNVVDAFFEKFSVLKGILSGFFLIWEVIKLFVGVFDAFKFGGFVEGIKQVGKSIVLWMLAPLEAILSASAAFGIGNEALAKIESFRAELAFKPPEKTPAINTEATKEQVRTERTESTNFLNLNIDSTTGKVTTGKIPQGIGVKLGQTAGAY